MVCDGYVKYDEVEVDRLVSFLKINNCGGGGGGGGGMTCVLRQRHQLLFTINVPD